MVLGPPIRENGQLPAGKSFCKLPMQSWSRMCPVEQLSQWSVSSPKTHRSLSCKIRFQTWTSVAMREDILPCQVRDNSREMKLGTPRLYETICMAVEWLHSSQEEILSNAETDNCQVLSTGELVQRWCHSRRRLPQAANAPLWICSDQML